MDTANRADAVIKCEASEGETLCADVLVVGAGGAGLAAAIEASQNGASVVVLEKMAAVGGNTMISGGAVNAVSEGSEIALRENDSLERHYAQTMSGGGNKAVPELVRTLVNGAWEGIQWLKSLGMEFEEEPFTVTGGLWKRAYRPKRPIGTGFFVAYMSYIDSHESIELRLKCSVDKLCVDEDGRVCGAVARTKDGGKITVKAERGVIIATGGFSANVALRQKYNTLCPDLSERYKSTNQPCATGDGIALMEALGAELVQMEHIQLLPLGDPKTGALSGNIERDVESRIFVNKLGKRFTDEGGRRDHMTRALMEQPDSFMWLIIDSHNYPSGTEKNNFNESIARLVASGRAIKANSLAELAEAINVPAENLIAAVDAFNAHVESREADEFGRTLFSTPINMPPYYAAGRTPTVHHTMGGVRIDKHARVLNKSGKPILGLYAAGEVTGGIHGENRLGGNALTETVVFGRIAGRNAALDRR